MSKPGRQTNPRLWGITLALLALAGFLFLLEVFLLVLIPLVVYFTWSMHLRIRELEHRLEGTPQSQGKQQT
jgi:uncharacterized protein (DUF58 family)